MGFAPHLVRGSRSQIEPKYRKFLGDALPQIVVAKGSELPCTALFVAAEFNDLERRADQGRRASRRRTD